MKFVVRTTWMAACLLFLSSAALFAQGGTIAGRVTGAESGAPIGGARIEVVSASGQVVQGGLSDGSGQFRITGVAPGTYAVVANMLGYAVSRTTGVRVAAGETATLTLALASSAVELNPIVVSASKRVERALEAPARVEVVGPREIAERPAVSPIDHLRAVPGVDIAQSGVQSSNVVARGFNNVFSGSLYALTDHRIAGVPSLRVNLMHIVPSTNEDIERIEVVLGPGSALYGPNTANGVLHMMTRSPLTFQGTTVTVAGGEQNVLHTTFRTAHRVGENFGFKVSGQYLQADEWQYIDRAETAERAKFAGNPAFWRQDLMRAVGITEAQANERIARIGQRDFDVRRWSGEARADWQATNALRTVFSVGTTTTNGIELTGLGASQTVDWRGTYYQVRANMGRGFAQAYVNTSNAGETFLLRNGAPIVDRSQLYVAQLQHGTSLGARQNFTYGADFLRTNPVTDGTINGIYEDNDQTTEMGAYLQSETALSPKFDLVLAGRVDTHSALPDPVFSPRAAIVFKAATDHAFRLTYNRAFSTPSSLNQFLDLGSSMPDAAAAQLGYSLRIQGTGDRGFTFRQPDGSYLMRAPATLGGPPTLIPANAAPFFPAALQVVRPQLRAGLIAQGLPAGTVDAMLGFLASQRPTSAQVGSTFFNPSTRQAGPLSSLDLEPIAPIRESTSNTIEAGYKGILGGRVLLAADLWYSKRENLITPLTIATPFVRLDGASTQAYLAQQLTLFFMGAGLPQAQAQAQAQALAPAIAGGMAQVPVGTISSADVNANSAQLLVTYFNVDDSIDLYGTDVSATANLTNSWSLTTSLSLVNRDVFTTERGERVTLNAPKSKGSVAANYRSEANGINAEARVRHSAGFPVVSGVYVGTECLGDTGGLVEECVKSYTLTDVSLGYRLPQIRGTTLQLTVQNLFDEEYRSFPGVPNIGRMALLRLKYEF